MTLLKETSTDDQFSKQLDKLQQAVAAIKKITDKAKEEKVKSLNWQKLAIEVAAEDLREIQKVMNA